MEIAVRFLVVGLGSMGKRRVRNLLALGHQQIAGFDPREDRRAEAHQKSGIETFSGFDLAVESFHPDVLVISTSPEYHMTYAWEGFERRVPCFIEASVVDADRIFELHKRTVDTPLVIVPSCTMRYFPGPKKVAELIRAGTIGRPLNINYQVGQYLPDWHPWERVEDFYVSNRATGACREIVPFELTWLNGIFGAPRPLACVKAKLTDINADIDDVYHCILNYPDGVLANICVEVISRPKATRELRVLGTLGEIVFSGEERCVRYANTAGTDWTRFELSGGTVEKSYINPEEPYIAEMRDFIEAVRQGDRRLFPNALLDDYHILQTLHHLEKLSESAK
jgi:predicted dehydrogenase